MIPLKNFYYNKIIYNDTYYSLNTFFTVVSTRTVRGLVVSVLANGPKVRGRWIFKGDKNPEVKPSVPCRRFTACKRNLRAWIKMLRKPNCLHFSSKSPDCLPDGSGVHIRIDRTLSAASWPVTNCHECAWLSNLEKRRLEEGRAHIGLLSHGYYYYYYMLLFKWAEYLTHSKVYVSPPQKLF
jgi:hypothetical protein